MAVWTKSLLLMGLGGLFGRDDDTRNATIDQLDREVLACRERLSAAQDIARSCEGGGPPPAVYTELLQAFADSEVEVHRDGPRVGIVVPGALLFAPESVEIRREARLVVDLLATALGLHPELDVWITGHTDDRPLSRTAQRLYPDLDTYSFAQANSLARILNQEFSVDRARLHAAGQGPSRPRVANETDGARQKNHRIVLVLGPREEWR